MKQSFLINDRIYLRAVEPEDMDVMYEMETRKKERISKRVAEII